MSRIRNSNKEHSNKERGMDKYRSMGKDHSMDKERSMGKDYRMDKDHSMDKDHNADMAYNIDKDCNTDEASCSTERASGTDKSCSLTDTQRILWMDIAKALGLLVVLVVHTGVSLGPVTYLGGMFYMPVFFILAGMTIRVRPGESFTAFLQKKARRLLLPYFGYNLFLFAFFFVKDSLLAGQVSRASFWPLVGILYSRNCLYGGSVENNVYFMQILNSPTWFLTALFVSLALYWLVCRAAGENRRNKLIFCAVILILAMALHTFCPVLLPWSLDCSLYAVAFLAVGEQLRESDLVNRLYHRPLGLLGMTAVFVALSYLNGSVNMSLAVYGRSMLLYLAVGTLGSLLCMEFSLFVENKVRFLARPLAFLGRHTLPVLCLHLFAYSVLGMVVRIMGILLAFLR